MVSAAPTQWVKERKRRSSSVYFVIYAQVNANLYTNIDIGMGSSCVHVKVLSSPRCRDLQQQPTTQGCKSSLVSLTRHLQGSVSSASCNEDSVKAKPKLIWLHLGVVNLFTDLCYLHVTSLERQINCQLKIKH